jgi:predicted nucleic acid-binding protein/GNAT superfamily N-acetyltransferase
MEGVVPIDDAPRVPVLVTPDSADPWFTAAFELGESQKKLVGMLPLEAWREYADDGRILVAVDSSADAPDQEWIVGYAAFRLPRQEVVLAHLVVAPAARGRNIARLLVDELSARYSERRGIRVKCRRDYEASAAWPKLGFIAQGDFPGRGRNGKRVTLWWRDHGHPDLMTWPGAPTSMVSAVIDANVFLDLHSDHAGARKEQTRALLTGSLEGRVQLLVSPELGNEINRGKHDDERARLHAIRLTYPSLRVDRDDVTRYQKLIEPDLGQPPTNQRDMSDLLHVAYAAAAGAQVVVTRDDKALRKLREQARELVGVTLVSPQELVALIDEVEGGPAYNPAALHASGYAMREAGVGDQGRLDAFIDTGASERRNGYTELLRSLAAHRPNGAHRLLITDPDNEPVALLGTDQAGGVLEVALLRMKPFALAASMAAQLVSQLRPLAQEAGVSAIRITDPHPHPLLSEALLGDGFAASTSGPVALSIPGVCSVQDLSTTVAAATGLLDDTERDALAGIITLSDMFTAENTAPRAAALERQLRPLRIHDAALDTWLVPIKAAWASQLFGVPADLIGQIPTLGISVEHVYYRGGRSGEQAPARVLWYVSGRQDPMVIGCSELIEVKDGTPKDQHREFRRLGVYAWAQVNESANKQGNVRALRVINTELFPNPMRLGRLRELAIAESQTLQLVSPRRISAGLFRRILEEVRT